MLNHDSFGFPEGINYRILKNMAQLPDGRFVIDSTQKISMNFEFQRLLKKNGSMLNNQLLWIDCITKNHLSLKKNSREQSIYGYKS